MNLKSLEYFIIIVEEMNITRAAERLFISQQALSSHMKRLEDEYQVTLFERRPSLHLTIEGEQMAFYARQILESESKLRTSLLDISQNCRGTLHVGISRLRSDVFFPEIWSYFHSSHPNIDLELVDGKSSALDERLQLGNIELYLGIDVPNNPNQHRIELLREKVQCCFSLSLLQQYYPDTWQELLTDFRENGADLELIIEMPFITLRRGNRLRQGLDLFFAHKMNPHLALECDQQKMIYEFSQKGAGVGLLSSVVFYQKRQEMDALKNEFFVFPVRNAIPENILSLVYRNDYPLPRYAMDFVQTTCMVFRSYSNSIYKNFLDK